MANPDEFINAVEEELRHDQLRAFWKNWQFVVYAMIAAVVLGVGGREAWIWYSKTQSEKASDTYTEALQALDKGELDVAQTKFDDLIKTAPSGYKAAAMQARAELSLRKGDSASAQKLLEEAAATGPDKDMRSAAAIKAAYVAMDKEDLAKLTTRLQPVIDRKGPFAAMAQEVLAAKAFDEGKLDEARSKYQSLLLALDAPEGVKQRAQVAMALLPPSQAKPAAAAADAATAGDKPAPKGDQ
ncbi:MAG: tetratricopeptide repeat protein [Caulobacterales bacterium]